MKHARIFIPLAFALFLTACGSGDVPPEVAPPSTPDSPYTPPDPITNVPNSPYVGDWGWATSLNGETLFTQGILSIARFDSTGRGTGSYAECNETCPSEPEGDGSLSIDGNSNLITIALYDEFEGKTYSVLFGIGFNGLQKDAQGRNTFQGSGNSELCVSTCIESDVNFIATQISTVPTYPPPY